MFGYLSTYITEPHNMGARKKWKPLTPVPCLSPPAHRSIHAMNKTRDTPEHAAKDMVFVGDYRWCRNNVLWSTKLQRQNVRLHIARAGTERILFIHIIQNSTHDCGVHRKGSLFPPVGVRDNVCWSCCRGERLKKQDSLCCVEDVQKTASLCLTRCAQASRVLRASRDRETSTSNVRRGAHNGA